MNRKILLLAHIGGIAMASAVAQALATLDPGEEVEIVTEEDRDNELLYGAGIGSPLGLSRMIGLKTAAIAMADTREYIPDARPGKNPDRHRPRDLYHSRKQGRKPR